MRMSNEEAGRGIGAAVVGAVLAVTLALGAGGPPEAKAGTRIDLNTASVEELTSLPGIGPARARAIVERRQEKPFASADELGDVPGIGDALVDRLRDQVEVARGEGRSGSEAGDR